MSQKSRFVIEWVTMSFRRAASTALALILVSSVGFAQRDSRRSGGWHTHGGNAAHTAIGTVRAQAIKRIVWSTPLDLNPQYNGDVLYAHYGSPVISDENVVVLPVKTGATSGFKIEARNGSSGALLWQENTDYVLPNHNWFPTLGPTLTGYDAAWARKAGLVAFRDLRKGRSQGSTSVCFYGMQNYLANPAAYDSAVRISSPIVTAEDGSLYFSYQVTGETPLGLQSGIAVVRKNGVSAYIEGTDASLSHQFVRPKLNAAPAIFRGVLYAALKKSSGDDGALVGLDAKTLRPLYEAPLLDPRNGNAAYVDDDGTACPTVGPDGDVFFGVLENPFGSHHYRGWLLHFNRTLTVTETPGSFGWDDSASIIPTSMVTGYKGKSSYLVMTKYNNYAGAGDGVNRVAVLDPNATMTDFLADIPVMKEVITKVGPTPDAGHVGSFPNAVREWCINTAAVDVKSRSVIVNNEDGIVYRWNLATNKLDQSVRITDGLGQAYTPTLIGPTGLVFAVSNARLFAVGQ